MYLSELMALLSIKGIGIQTVHKLLSFYGSFDVLVERLSRDALYDDTKIKATKGVCKAFNEFDGRKYHEALKREGVKAISYMDDLYPTVLKGIDHFPLVLHYKGNLMALNKNSPGISVVGSRKISPYGKRVAFDLGCFLGGYSIPVISGLAYGVDYEAHQGVIKSGGFPVAVVANGLDKVYPKEHSGFANRISSRGVLMTEEFLYSELAPYKFPIRNRIISGLSEVIVVVEAEEKSGSLITAQHGLDQGKIVYAVPGSIYSDTSRGTNDLIAQGAIPLLDFKQLLQHFDHGCNRGNIEERENNDINLNLIEKKVLSIIKKRDYVSIEEIVHFLNKKPSEVSVILMKLEITGQIREVGGNKYTLL